MKVLNLLIAGVFMAGTTAAMAADTTASTNTKSNWICTTNASNSSVESEKAADDKMAKTKASAADAFTFATENCRDCTKITCSIETD